VPEAVVVRSARPGDADELVPLARAALTATYSPIAQPAVYEAVIDQTCTVAAFSAAIAAADPAHDAHFLVAEGSHGLLGFLDFGADAEGLELRRLYVKVGTTGAGIGTTLLRELEERLPPQTRYRAIAHAKNEAGLRFWERHGFVASGEVDTRAHFAAHRGLGFDAASEPEPSVLLWRTTDAEEYEITLRDALASPTAVVARATTWEEFPRLWRVLLDEVYAFVRGGGATQTGHNIMLYRDDVPNVEVGVQVAGAFVASGDVTPSELPAGRVASTVHRGDYGRLDAAHAAVRAWCAAHGHALTGTRWEIYGDWREDPEEVESEVCYLVS
jgi:effector-binding domain-containing protein/GNAT superfamily N-acetyltransferase